MVQILKFFLAIKPNFKFLKAGQLDAINERPNYSDRLFVTVIRILCNVQTEMDDRAGYLLKVGIGVLRNWYYHPESL